MPCTSMGAQRSMMSSANAPLPQPISVHRNPGGGDNQSRKARRRVWSIVPSSDRRRAHPQSDVRSSASVSSKLQQNRLHSGLMPANLMTLPHLSVSSAMKLPKWAAEPVSAVASKRGEPGPELGVGECGVDLPVQGLDDVGRRVHGRAEAKPDGGLVARHELTQRRNIRQQLGASRAGCCEGAQQAVPNVLASRRPG